MKKQELIGLLEKAMIKNLLFVQSQKGETNPQITKMVYRCEGRNDILLAVITALRGSLCYLKIEAGE